MIKSVILVLVILFIIAFPSFAKTGEGNLQVNKKNIDITKSSQQLFNNLPTPLYDQYIDKKNGLSFDSLIDKTIQANRNFLLNQQDIAAAQGHLLQSGLLLNPNLEIEAGTNAIIDRSSEYGFNLTYTHPIELFGKPGKRYRVAELQLESLKNEIQFRNQQFISEIRKQYINTIVKAESLKFTEQLLALNSKLLKLTEGKYINGDISKFDTNLIHIEVNRLHSQQITAENRVKTSLVKLKTLLGMDIDQDLKLSGKLFSTALLPEKVNLKEIQDIALNMRYDLKSAVINQDAAQVRITEQEAEAYPNINAFGKYNRQKSTFDNTPVGSISDTDNTISGGISFDLPVFNRNQGNIEEAQAFFNQSKLRKELLEQEIRRDAALAYNNLQAAKQSVLLYENQILKDSGENLWITRRTNELGEQDLLFVIIGQNRLADVQKEYIDALKEYNLSVIELESALGGSLQEIILQLKGEKK